MGLIQERRGPVRETAEPSGIGRSAKQPVLPVLVGAAGALESLVTRPRRRCADAPAGLSAARADAMPRHRGRRRRARGARHGGRRQRREGAGQSIGAPRRWFGRAGASPDAARERMPEYARGIPAHAMGAAASAESGRKVQPEWEAAASGPWHTPPRADGRREDEGVTGTLRKRPEAHEVCVDADGGPGRYVAHRGVGQPLCVPRCSRRAQRVPALSHDDDSARLWLMVETLCRLSSSTAEAQVEALEPQCGQVGSSSCRAAIILRARWRMTAIGSGDKKAAERKAR
jgi:hypothetical protein